MGKKTTDNYNESKFWSNPHTEELFSQKKNIRRIIKIRIHLYEPLKFKNTYRAFMDGVVKKNLYIIRGMLERTVSKKIRFEIIKFYLIKTTYFALELEEKFIRWFILNKLNYPSFDDLLFHEIVDHIKEKLEKDDLKKLRKFKERCKFKWYLVAVMRDLLKNYWRHLDVIKKFESKLETLFEQISEDPTIKIEKEELDPLLTPIFKELKGKEKLVNRLFYEIGLNITLISRTLDINRDDAQKFIEQTELKIKKKVLERSKHKGD